MTNRQTGRRPRYLQARMRRAWLRERLQWRPRSVNRVLRHLRRRTQ